MSWSNFTQIEAGANREAIREQINALAVTGNEDAGEARDEQVEAAKAAAIFLIESSAFGDGGRGLRVSLAGHVNPGHQPQIGSLYESVSVSVTREFELPSDD